MSTFTPNEKFPLKYKQKGAKIKELQIALKVESSGNFYNQTETAIQSIVGNIGLTYSRDKGVNAEMFNKIKNYSIDQQRRNTLQQSQQQLISSLPTNLPLQSSLSNTQRTLEARIATGSIIPTTAVTASLPQIPPPQKINVAGLLTPDVVSALKDVRDPKAFGDQVWRIAARKTASGIVNSEIAQLYIQKKDLIEEGILLDIQHKRTLNKLKQQNVPRKKLENGNVVDADPIISNEEYEALIKKENENYTAAKENLKERKKTNQDLIDKWKKDPWSKAKKRKADRKLRRALIKTRTKEQKQKARKDKLKKVYQGAKGALTPILIATTINQLELIIAQNTQMKKLVDSTNDFITRANTSNDPNLLLTAKIYRDNALRILNNNIKRITDISSRIQKYQTYVNIFSVIVTIITAIPIPTSVPPGVGIPVNFIMKLVRILDKANRIISSLTSYIAEVLVSLENIVSILENYKLQLLEVNNTLEGAATGSFVNSSGSIGPSSFNTLPFGSQTFPPYKNFTFALRQENNPSFVVAGNKRHYAVAINRQNVEQLKSQPSFTLDPNDLIEELKLIIDRQNLQG